MKTLTKTTAFSGLLLFSGFTLAERPNILWITSEDNGLFLGCYGDKNADTPHLDNLAERGVRFTHCYANSPVCAVARSSWITGFAAPSAGMQHMRSKYRLPASITTYAAALREAGYYATNNNKTDYNTSSFDRDIWDESSRTAHYMNRAEGQPFFAIFNIESSHEGQIFEEHYPQRYPNPKTISEHIEIPPYQVTTEAVLTDWQRMYDRIHEMDAHVGRLLDELKQHGEAENTIVFYCADHSGITLRSKRYLYDSGVHVPFIVYVPEKWKQWSAGEPGSVNERLVQFIDMPKAFLTIAEANIPEAMTGRAFLGVDAEPAHETIFLFSNRFDAAPDMRRGLTDGRWKYIRNYEPDRPRFQMLDFPWRQAGQQSQWHAYITGRTDSLQSAYYKPQPSEELFDTWNDPHEVVNLAGKESYFDKLVEMRAELDRHILETRDLGFIPEPLMEAIDKAGGETIFGFGQSEENYPLHRILPLANLAAARNTENISELLDAMKDTNPIVRYWGVLGLRILGFEARTALADLESALDDPDFSTRITAILAYGKLGGQARETAIELLLREAIMAEYDIHALWALDGLKFLDAPGAVAGIAANELVRGHYSRRAYDRLAAGGSTYRMGRE